MNQPAIKNQFLRAHGAPLPLFAIALPGVPASTALLPQGLDIPQLVFPTQETPQRFTTRGLFLLPEDLQENVPEQQRCLAQSPFCCCDEEIQPEIMSEDESEKVESDPPCPASPDKADDKP